MNPPLVKEDESGHRYSVFTDSQPTGYRHRVQIEQVEEGRLLQELTFDSELPLNDATFRVGAFYPDGLPCVRVVDKDDFKTWRWDPEKGYFAFVAP